jgi:hypothetical protein
MVVVDFSTLNIYFEALLSCEGKKKKNKRDFRSVLASIKFKTWMLDKNIMESGC